MSFAERAQNPVGRTRPGFACSVGEILAGLPPKEREALKGMLDDVKHWPHIGPGSIEEALTAEGFDVAQSQIGRHRRGACRCVKGDDLR